MVSFCVNIGRHTPGRGRRLDHERLVGESLGFGGVALLIAMLLAVRMIAPSIAAFLVATAVVRDLGRRAPTHTPRAPEVEVELLVVRVEPRSQAHAAAEEATHDPQGPGS